MTRPRYIQETDPNPHFERWKFHIGIENCRGEKLTEEQLRKWADDPNHLLECVFCQITEPPSYFKLSYTPPPHLDPRGKPIKITACPRCREYKGIQPHIPGWSNFE